MEYILMILVAMSFLIIGWCCFYGAAQSEYSHEKRRLAIRSFRNGLICCLVAFLVRWNLRDPELPVASRIRQEVVAAIIAFFVGFTATTVFSIGKHKAGDSKEPPV